jgi:hypothetical protein
MNLNKYYCSSLKETAAMFKLNFYSATAPTNNANTRSTEDEAMHDVNVSLSNDNTAQSGSLISK